MATKKTKTSSLVQAGQPKDGAMPPQPATSMESTSKPDQMLMLDLPEPGEKPGEEKVENSESAPRVQAQTPETARPMAPTMNSPEQSPVPASMPAPANPAPVTQSSKDSFQAAPAPGRTSVQLEFNESDSPLHTLEAALFMSGQPIGAAELAKLVGIAALGHVNEQLTKLAGQYDKAGSALEVVQEENGKWTMRVRATYAGSVRNFAGEAEISRHALRTLAYISRNDGIKKRDLFGRLGSTIYEDVAELLDKGFVSATPVGRTVSLKTTAKFKQYFQG